MAFMRKQSAPAAAGYATPERAALAHAIAAHAAAVANVTATDEAGRLASEAVWTAQAVITTAQEAVNEAWDATARHLVAAAGGADEAPPRTERQARADLADAEAALEDARAARDALKGRLPDAEADLARAVRTRTEAARAVIAAEAAGAAVALAAEVERLQRAALRKGAALTWLANAGALPLGTVPGGEHGRPTDPAIRAMLYQHEQSARAHSHDGWNQAAAAMGALPWEATLAALESDAAAPLPA